MSLTRGALLLRPLWWPQAQRNILLNGPFSERNFFFAHFTKKKYHFFIHFLVKPKYQFTRDYKYNVKNPHNLQNFMVPYARERCSHQCYAAHTRKTGIPNIAHLPPGRKKKQFFIFFNPPFYPKNASF